MVRGATAVIRRERHAITMKRLACAEMPVLVRTAPAVAQPIE